MDLLYQKLKKFLFGLSFRDLKIKNPDIKKKIGTPKGPIYKKFVKELSVQELNPASICMNKIRNKAKPRAISKESRYFLLLKKDKYAFILFIIYR